MIITSDTATLVAECAYCGQEGTYEMDEQETKTLDKYMIYGRQMGLLQNLFPKVPAWIRLGAIDQFSGGFCICPECSPF